MRDEVCDLVDISTKTVMPKHFKHSIYTLFMLLWVGPIRLIVGICATALFYSPKVICPHIVFLLQNALHEIHFGIDILWKLYVEHRSQK